MSAWYINRLKTMSLPEILFRIDQALQKQKERLSYSRNVPFSPLLSSKGKIINADLSDVKLFKNSVNIFGKKFNYIGPAIDWHKDIFSGESFPRIFSKNINIRINPKASAKNVWEINRLQFLPHIVINYKISGKEDYLLQFMKILSSWIDENPYLVGVNWYSNIEINIRLINWFLCWQLLDAEELIAKNDKFSDFVSTKWLPSIYQHCYYSYHNPSKFSSANNHLVSEYAGLFIASSLWKFKASERWLKYAAKGLEKEIRLQHSSGINKEEAAEYIQFITDFFLLAYIIGEKTNRPFSKIYTEQLKEIFSYICHFLDSKGNFPKYGDEDDGKCLILSNDDHFNNFRSLLTTGSILFGNRSFKSKSNGFDTKNAILLGEEGKKNYGSVKKITTTEISSFYRKEGHFIFRKQVNEKEIYLHFDAAPLGYLSIAAHGHADALSFILNIDGQPVFIDSGTYTYHTEPEWRKYFIGTLAHNTVRINRKDQAVNAGPTMWLKHFKTTVIVADQSEDVESVKATHNGYESDGTVHIREIIFNKKRNEFIISDTVTIENGNTIEVEIPFHLHPEIGITNFGTNTFLLNAGTGSKIEFCPDDKLDPKIVNGQTEPQILGWYSESFMKKGTTNVIYCYARLKSSSTFNHVIKIL